MYKALILNEKITKYSYLAVISARVVAKINNRYNPVLIRCARVNKKIFMLFVVYNNSYILPSLYSKWQGSLLCHGSQDHA